MKERKKEKSEMSLGRGGRFGGGGIKREREEWRRCVERERRNPKGKTP